jgi:hypothetical protein
MLMNFHLAALTVRQDQKELFHIPLHQALQGSLAETWGQQLDIFSEDVEAIAFNAGYKPESHERFLLSDFDLPASLRTISSVNVQNQPPISEHEESMTSVKAIVAFCRNMSGQELVLFQSFSRSHVIEPGSFLILAHNTYQSADRPGIQLDNKLTAVYSTQDKKLLFHNFRVANTFLPLAEFYEEASEETIRDILNHKILAPEDVEALAVGANQWFRKRFAMLKDSGVLDQYSPQQIKKRAKDCDVEVNIAKGRIVFPAAKGAAKKLLQFLNEEIYRGAITDTLYETNSKREAD